jgi:hypothetical protein
MIQVNFQLDSGVLIMLISAPIKIGITNYQQIKRRTANYGLSKDSSAKTL